MGASPSASSFDLESITTPVWVYDFRAARVVRANTAAVEFWGAEDAADLMARDFSVDMTPGVRQRLDSCVLRLSAGERIRETWTFFPHGRPITVSCVMSPFTLPGGALAMLVEAQRVGDETSVQDRRNVEALRHVSVAIMVVDAAGRLVTRNTLAAALFPGLREGREAGDILSSAAARAAFVEAMARRRGFSDEVEVETAEGPRWMAVDARPVLDPVTGDPAALLCMVDVTERFRLEEDLREYDRTLQAILDTAPVPLTVTRPVDGRVVYANEQMGAMMGVRAASLIGLDAASFYVDPSQRQALLESLDADGAVQSIVVHVRAAKGGDLPVRVSARLILFHGEPAVISALASIEAEERAQRLLGQALDKQQRIAEAQRRFVSMLGHEFRTPLSIIDGTARRVQRRGGQMSAEDIGRWMERLRQAAGRMDEMITDVLALTQVEDGCVILDRQAVDVAALIATVADRHRDLSQNHRIDLPVSGLDRRVTLDPRLMDIALSNLLSNAIKYSPAGGTVTITAEGDGDRLRIAVSDQGVGMPDDEIPHVFDRFFRCSTSVGIEGTGLGLDICRQLVEMHGGTVTAQSTVGVGSTFILELPLESAAAWAQGSGAEPP
jgi:PAS domain S-box-containing protein